MVRDLIWLGGLLLLLSVLPFQSLSGIPRDADPDDLPTASRPAAAVASYISTIRADFARRGVCGGWDDWPPVSGQVETLAVDRNRSDVPGLESHDPTSTLEQLLWSATLRIEQAAGAPLAAGYSIERGLGSISSSGFTLGAAHFGVLSALQHEDEFELAVVGADRLPGGFIVDVHGQDGRRIARLSSCDSVEAKGKVGSRFRWPDAQVNWQSAETATIAVLRSDGAGQDQAVERSAASATHSVRFEGVPAHHDGETFSITLRLLEGSDEVRGPFEAGDLSVTAGSVTRIERSPDRDDLWRVEIRPDSRRSVVIHWLDDADCLETDEACPSDRFAAAAPQEIVVPGPPITARALELPEYHSGLKLVSFEIQFSEPVFISHRELGKGALSVGAATLHSVRRPDGRRDLLEVTVLPHTGEDVTIELTREHSCTNGNRICLNDLRRLPAPLRVTIPAATVYLTFDDGPHPVYTPQILDILADYNARATFFVIGRSVKAFPQLIQRIVREGHTLANHTWNHDVLADLTQEEFDETVTRTQQALGVHATPCLRPPNFRVDDHTEPWAAELGLRLIMATAGTEDWARPGAGAIASRLFAAAKADAIIVLHDGGGDRSQTVEGLRYALWSLRGFRYSYDPICHPQP